MADSLRDRIAASMPGFDTDAPFVVQQKGHAAVFWPQDDITLRLTHNEAEGLMTLIGDDDHPIAGAIREKLMAATTRR